MLRSHCHNFDAGSASGARSRISLLAMGSLSMAIIACSPVQPSATVALRSIKYVRTRPITSQAQTLVGLVYSYPIIGDPEHRNRVGEVSLKPVDDTTFTYDFAPQTFGNLPIDTDIGMSVDDAAVSASSVARDLYVNDTKIRVVVAGTQEGGVFRVRSDGTVY